MGWAGLLIYGYAAAGLIGGAIPVNRGWRAPAQGVTIWVASNGIHTDLIVPKVVAGNGWRVDWRPLLRPEHLRDPRYAGYGYAGFGWGDAKFYRETPEWQDVRPATVLAAAVGSDATLVHAIHLPRPTPAVVRTLAKRLDSSCSSPHRTSRTSPRKSSWIIASLSGGCLSQTSCAML